MAGVARARIRASRAAGAADRARTTRAGGPPGGPGRAGDRARDGDLAEMTAGRCCGGAALLRGERTRSPRPGRCSAAARCSPCSVAGRAVRSPGAAGGGRAVRVEPARAAAAARVIGRDDRRSWSSTRRQERRLRRPAAVVGDPAGRHRHGRVERVRLHRAGPAVVTLWVDPDVACCVGARLRARVLVAGWLLCGRARASRRVVPHGRRPRRRGMRQ